MMNLPHELTTLNGELLLLLEQRAFRAEKRACEESLSAFIKQAWKHVEQGQDYKHGWHIDALGAHLEAMERGDEIDGALFNRLLINIPPGMMKSLLVGVFFPAWCWGPRNKPHLRFLCASHSMELAIRDNMRARRLMSSDWYQERWGERVKFAGDQNAKSKFETSAGGFRQAVAAGSITGARGDFVIIDDPNSVEGAASDAMRQTTNEWFLEAVPTRLNDPIRSCIIVIMQRLHDADVSGTILEKNLGYVHLCLPMEFEPDRECYTGVPWVPPWSEGGEQEPFVDPRSDDGELLFPLRFPADVVARDKMVMGNYATAGQFQQRPVLRGGGILPRDGWEYWSRAVALKYGRNENQFPDLDYIVASLDTAYTEKQENDYSAFTAWGVWHDTYRRPKIMLLSAWQERLQINELVNKTILSCRKIKADRLLIEAKASGHSVAQEIRRLNGEEEWVVQLVNPGAGDKVARAYSVQPLFGEQMDDGRRREGIIYVPCLTDSAGHVEPRVWADMVITNCESFPKGKHDDLLDSTVHALRHLRDCGFARRVDELDAEDARRMEHRSQKVVPLYPGSSV